MSSETIAHEDGSVTVIQYNRSGDEVGRTHTDAECATVNHASGTVGGSIIQAGTITGGIRL